METRMAANDKQQGDMAETTEDARRRFLKQAGRAAVVTPAAVTLILAAGTKKALARP